MGKRREEEEQATIRLTEDWPFCWLRKSKYIEDFLLVGSRKIKDRAEAEAFFISIISKLATLAETIPTKMRFFTSLDYHRARAIAAWLSYMRSLNRKIWMDSIFESWEKLPIKCRHTKLADIYMNHFVRYQSFESQCPFWSIVGIDIL